MVNPALSSKTRRKARLRTRYKSAVASDVEKTENLTNK